MTHLPRRLLASTASASRRKKAGIGNKRFRTEAEEFDNAPDALNAPDAAGEMGKWTRKDPGLVGSRIPAFVKPARSQEDEETFESVSTAYDYYRLFQPDSWANEILYQSKLYGTQRQFSKKVQDLISFDVYRCTEAMMLHSGYNNIPRRRMMWEQKMDCHNVLVSEALRRDEGEAMLKCLHFRDNTKADGDSYFKLRPIFQQLNKGARFFLDSDRYSVDEIMVPYYGRHSSKQFIHGKPVRYGYKIWCLATSDGAGVWFEPYCGKDTRIENKNLGQGPNVVLDLVDKVKLNPGCELFFDNLFTSFPLLDELSQRQLAGTGTVRQNKLFWIPIKKKKDLEAKTVPRGTKDVLYNGDKVLVGWRDSKAVYMASNKFNAATDNNCKRYNRVTKKDVLIPIPNMFYNYNGGMGGVDNLDSMVAVYRIPFRVRKWWSPFYTWSLSVSSVNAWRLRMKITGEKEPYLSFLRELVIQMLTNHGRPALKKLPGPATDEQQYDGMNHWIGQLEDGKKKRRNCKVCYQLLKKEMKTPYFCKKCNVALHVLCFEELQMIIILCIGIFFSFFLLHKKTYKICIKGG